ncbi:GPW/gp25 family protein [Novosphingobium sp. TCA1]|uniref:GPW/gp25 family protein n=1 Tax=Novosphingobium sp. TCA1 TaxID=2682474 RepID=UPI0013072131|nr:GPW/gp25 family protein [Novosphingobium sp. TCA1]GFE76239.1 baseplate assembly protein [Novosphingobium sp. TCA1]
MAAMDETTGELIEGDDDIRQSAKVILRTRIGSCVGRREFGSLVPDLIDKPMTRANILRVYAATVIALTRWEDRIRLDQVGLKAGTSPGSAVVVLDTRRTDTASNARSRLLVPVTL